MRGCQDQKGIAGVEKPWLERTVLRGESRKRATNGPLRVFLPSAGSSNLPWTRAVVGKGVPIKPIVHGERRVWELAANHLLPLAAAMADRYGEVEMRLQVSPTMNCTYSCKNARPDTVWECVCECGGRHHSGQDAYDDWYSKGRFRIERQGEIEVRYLQIQRGQIPLPPHISPAALQRALPRSAQPTTPAQRQNPRPPLRLAPTPSPAPQPQPEPAPPLPRPRAVPAPPPMQQPRTASAGARDLGSPPPGAAAPQRQPEPPIRVVIPECSKPGQPSGRLAVAAAVVAAIGLGLWLVLPADSTDEPAGTSTSETVQEDSIDSPPPVAEEPAPPPTVQAPAPVEPVRPRGCYPFQPNCS